MHIGATLLGFFPVRKENKNNKCKRSSWCFRDYHSTAKRKDMNSDTAYIYHPPTHPPFFTKQYADDSTTVAKDTIPKSIPLVMVL